MKEPGRPILRLKGRELVPAEEDRRVDLGEFHLLLPCREYEIEYKIAELGKLSPTLEFLLRLAKAAPGISDQDAAAFFGYSPREMRYVVEEALGPGYAEVVEGRIWITSAGESLFRDGEKEPAIFSVESKRRSFGFDLLSIAPQRHSHMDDLELSLPELPLADPVAAGRISERIPARFSYFFRELQERQGDDDRRGLYSVDSVIAGNRFSSPVRVRTFAQASSPWDADVDLSSWRSDHELADRQEVERAVALLVKETRAAAQLEAPAAYQKLVDFAPDFLKEFVTRNGLSVNRYWREAVGRAGEARTDRRTVPIAGSLCLQENVGRLASIIEYGLFGKDRLPESILTVAPQLGNWAATTFQREIIATIRHKVGQEADGRDQREFRAVCLFSGKPPWHVLKTFDEVRTSEFSQFPAALEILLVPNIAAFVVVHAPIGAAAGYPVPLGLASFDPVVVDRVGAYLAERMTWYATTQ